LAVVCCINLHFTVQFIAVVLILLHLLGTIASFYADFSPVSLSLSLVINQDGIKGFFWLQMFYITALQCMQLWHNLYMLS